MSERAGNAVPLAWAAIALAVAGCGGGDPGGAEPTTPPPEVTGSAPPVEDTGPGTAVLVLGPETFELDVTACSLAPVLDPATNVVTDLAVTASGGGIAVEARQESFTTDVVTVTETVQVGTAGGDQLVESRRVDAGGRILDLRVPGADRRSFERPDGTLLVVEGRFGTPGARGPLEDDLDGRLVARCAPPAPSG